jgi:hypothetical protein
MNGECGCTYRLKLVLLESGNEIANEKGQVPSKVDNFVHDEGSHSGNEDFVAAIVHFRPVLFSPRQIVI